MGWQGHLRIDYTLDTPTSPSHAAGTTALDRHSGPLRVLQRLYPEGPQVCHHVLVHPPGGIVGGDLLDIELNLAPGTHALLTTPGATRFYRSEGAPAAQRLVACLADGARLEWLPMETIAYSGCEAENRLRFELAPGAEMMGWDVLALGLPAARQAFEKGCIEQHIELPGVWLERGRIAAQDRRLLESPLGLAGHKVLGTLWFATGQPMSPTRRQSLLDAARETAEMHPLRPWVGITSPHIQMTVCRVLGERVEPVANLLRTVWAIWRQQAWSRAAVMPRLWST